MLSFLLHFHFIRWYSLLRFLRFHEYYDKWLFAAWFDAGAIPRRFCCFAWRAEEVFIRLIFDDADRPAMLASCRCFRYFFERCRRLRQPFRLRCWFSLLRPPCRCFQWYLQAAADASAAHTLPFPAASFACAGFIAAIIFDIFIYATYFRHATASRRFHAGRFHAIVLAFGWFLQLHLFVFADEYCRFRFARYWHAAVSSDAFTALPPVFAAAAMPPRSAAAAWLQTLLSPAFLKKKKKKKKKKKRTDTPASACWLTPARWDIRRWCQRSWLLAPAAVTLLIRW